MHFIAIFTTICLVFVAAQALPVSDDLSLRSSTEAPEGGLKSLDKLGTIHLIL
ncbi:hypothetical protein HYPSUDRAFT_48650 [Hypholoma sublateritium FD-334 SS-4]|uniref:Uncharacterized protein n=1 Tax=Hypholoma sublateritium (strain FD-334 SS-4) TaxID=945553 RepID=A0A0D2LWA7_HYPSF|nr:hypothetical protein HYPSUDRAFT_48650 [Hypholoma sublateritium FD-334 SS-4]